MLKKTVSEIMLALLVMGMLALAFNIQSVKAGETIYIRVDGSVDPPTAPISTVDNVTYIFTANIYDLIIVERDNIIINGNGFTVQGSLSGKGISLTGRKNVTITNATIKNFEYGVGLSDAYNNTIAGNNITASTYYGIWLSSSYNNTITGNNITNNRDGIRISGSSNNNTIAGNNITANSVTSIEILSASNNNTITGNNMINNWGGIRISGSSNNNTIAGNNITASTYYGITLSSSYNNTITGNNITNNRDGIRISSSYNNTIAGNNITNNIYYGIWLSDAYNNTITGNNITNNRDGIFLESAYNNIIAANVFTGGGLALYDSYGNLVENNLVNGKPLVYLEGVSDYVVEDAGQVILVNCNNMRIENLNLSNTNYAIQLEGTNNTNIINNHVTANVYGIWLSSSYNNTIAGNNITNNIYYGIWLSSSYNNTIYHNNFINNNVQAYILDSINVWDDGYPSGGNYWSGYTGADLYSGPYQNVTGSDGIGDTPQVIDASNQDRYPLMAPFGRDIALLSIASFKTVVGQGYTTTINVTARNRGFLEAEFKENFNISIYANSTLVGTGPVSLVAGASLIITFTWNTTQFAKGNYTLWAYAEPVPGETNVADNTVTYGIVTVTIPGDVDGDIDVDIYDIVRMCVVYGSKQGEPRYVPNCDINCDGKIDIYDVVIACVNYGQRQL